MNRPLWDDPQREEWFGGGADHPGIHSVCVDPRDARHVIVGVSCGGVWSTKDGAGSWQLTGRGMRAEYMPPERQFEPNVQDPHVVVQSRANPDVLWVQHHNGIFRSTDAARSWGEITDENPRPLALRWRSILPTPIPPSAGSRTRNAIRWMDVSLSIALETAAGHSKR